jgi:hypothetical protein
VYAIQSELDKELTKQRTIPPEISLGLGRVSHLMIAMIFFDLLKKFQVPTHSMKWKKWSQPDWDSLS